MTDLINNETIGTVVEGAADVAGKIDDSVVEPVKKGVSKVVVAAVSAVVGFGSGVAAKIGWDALKEKKAQNQEIEAAEQPKIEADYVEDGNFEEIAPDK